MRHCHEDAEYALFEIDGTEFRRCPVQFIEPESFDALDAYRFYRDGFLPVAGGIYDQPAKAMELIGIVGAIAADELDEKRRRAKR